MSSYSFVSFVVLGTLTASLLWLHWSLKRKTNNLLKQHATTINSLVGKWEAVTKEINSEVDAIKVDRLFLEENLSKLKKTPDDVPENYLQATLRDFRNCLNDSLIGLKEQTKQEAEANVEILLCQFKQECNQAIGEGLTMLEKNLRVQLESVALRSMELHNESLDYVDKKLYPMGIRTSRDTENEKSRNSA